MKHNGEVYSFSPYEMLWDGDFYYVIGYDDRHDDVIKFRVDKIVKLCITELDAVPQSAGFSVDEYINRVFRMYNGRAEEVVLKRKSECMGAIIDEFGKAVKTKKLDESAFIATVSVSVSPTFYAWLFTFGGKMTISSPEAVRNEYVEMCRNVIANFGEIV